jgi:hypothetical protein
VLRAKGLLGVAAAVKRHIMDRNRGVAAGRCPGRLVRMGRKGKAAEVNSC